MSQVLERNIAALLRRAYQPERPDPAFERRLLGTLQERVAGRARLSPLERGVRLAAGVLILIGVGWLARTRLAPTTPAQAPLSIARVDGVDRLLALRRHTELSAGDAPLELTLVSGDCVHLEPGARAALTYGAPGEANHVEHRGGRLALELGRWSPALELSSAHGSLVLAQGRLELAPRDGPGLEALLVAGRAYTENGVPLAPGRPLTWLDGTLVARADPRLDDDGGGRRDASSLAAAALDGELDGEPHDAPGDAYARVVGHVREVSGAPLDPAALDLRVWLRREVELPKVSEPERLQVDADGRFSSPALEPGPVSIFVEAAGRATWIERRLELAAGEVRELAPTLGPGVAVRGFVVDAETGAPLASALVLAEADVPDQVLPAQGLDRPETPHAHALSDASGAFELPHVSPGSHVLRVSHPDFAPRWTPALRFEPGAVVDAGTTALERGGRIEGRAEREDGSPFAGAEIITALIELRRASPTLTFGYDVTTWEGGFAIEHLPPGYYVAMNLGEQPNEAEPWRRVLQCVVREGETTRVDFVQGRSETRLDGRLLDPGGAPAAGRTLTLMPQDPAHYGLDSWVATQTDGTGRFRFDAVEPGAWQLFVSADGMQAMTWVCDVTLEAGQRGPLAIELSGLQVEVRAVDAGTRAPVAAFALFERLDAGRWVFAGKAGEPSQGPAPTRFSHMPPGRYRVSVFTHDHGHAIGEGFDLAPGQALEREFALEPGGGLVLSVVDAAGAPVGGAEVELRDPHGAELRFAPIPRTDEHGRLGVPSLAVGSYTLLARRPGARSALEPLEVLPGETSEVTLVLIPR